jgi:hypothetical protein
MENQENGAGGERFSDKRIKLSGRRHKNPDIGKPKHKEKDDIRRQ